MELKNAASICLISFFSATLVVLIARALDLQAVARLEPQLARLADELQALRRQGGFPAAGTAGLRDAERVTVYYLHSSARCPTCRAVESQTFELLKADFASELSAGTVVWKALNYERPEAAALAKTFGVTSFAVVLAKGPASETADWKRLDRAAALVGNKDRFASYVREEIQKMLRPAQTVTPRASAGEMPKAKDADPAAADQLVSPDEDLPIPP